MRILLILEVYLPKVDGVVMRTVRLLERLQQQGDEVLVVCPAAPGRGVAPVALVEYPSFPFRAYPEYWIGIPDDSLARVVARFAPDVIHYLNPFAFGFRCYDVLQRAGCDVPRLFSFHTLYGEFVKRYSLLGPLSRGLWRLTRSYHNCAHVNLTVSEAMQQELQRRGFERVEHWPPAVDSQLFRPDRGTAAMRARLSGDAPDAPLALTVSRLAPEKNVALLAEVLRKSPGVRLAVVGDGPQRAELERRFDPNRTRFVGYLHGEQLAEAYASADAFVYASETETMGNVILEAMAAGLPIVAPSAGGIPSLIDDHQNGLLYAPGDARHATALLSAALANRASGNRLGHAARRAVVDCTWEAAADKVREHYAAAIARHADGQPTQRLPWTASAATATLVRSFRAIAPRHVAPTRRNLPEMPELPSGPVSLHPRPSIMR